mmetsp:Transcript_68109/g.163455  ORF Transcript_68109/g.163455 Transcript_68109/m.163455 type:complete len:230 (-) Transcript_68109:363-1052(-)
MLHVWSHRPPQGLHRLWRLGLGGAVFFQELPQHTFLFPEVRHKLLVLGGGILEVLHLVCHRLCLALQLCLLLGLASCIVNQRTHHRGPSAAGVLPKCPLQLLSVGEVGSRQNGPRCSWSWSWRRGGRRWCRSRLCRWGRDRPGHCDWHGGRSCRGLRWLLRLGLQPLWMPGSQQGVAQVASEVLEPTACGRGGLLLNRLSRRHRQRLGDRRLRTGHRLRFCLWWGSSSS